jgi:DNA (cytosine-5)-methyltransferase 1
LALSRCYACRLVSHLWSRISSACRPTARLIVSIATNSQWGLKMARGPRLKALDLFCGAGGASMGLHHAGFEITGVDIEPQPHYPFKFHRADALTFPLDSFDFIWASPPCQAYTLCQRIRSNSHPDLISSVRERLEHCGTAWVIENVVGAPLRKPVELCGTMFGLRTYRHRLFECSFPVRTPPHPAHTAPLRKMGRPLRAGEFMHIVGNFSGATEAREIMGTPWMPRDRMREAVPPAYAEYIGRAALS